MLSKSMGLRTLAAVLLLAVFMAGCTTATASVTPTAAGPTANALPTFDQVRTQAAQTVVAGLTQAALSATPVPPTDTPAPTFTNTPANTATQAFTNTPVLPTVKPTNTYIPWTLTPANTSTPVGSPTPIGFGCTVTSVSPKSTDAIKTGATFDGNWVIKNTGVATWLSADVDIKYLSGTKFQAAGKDIWDTKSDTASGASYTAIVDMTAPADAGTYTATWSLAKGSIPFCTLNLTVTVVK